MLRPAVRRGFVGLVVLVAVSGLSLFTACHAGRPAPAKNVLVICIDTLRADRLSCYGAERQTTPAIDEIAKRGSLFEQAQAQSNWTVPSTASLMTSLLPSEHGAGLEGATRNLHASTPRDLRPSVETLAMILKENGFSTALFSANPCLGGRFKAGFDHPLVRRYLAKRLTDVALLWLWANPDSRFFLYVQYIDVHQPIEAPGDYRDYFPVPGGGERTERHREWAFEDGNGLDTDDFRLYKANRFALYDGALRSIDDQIRRLLGSLRRKGLLDDTLVVVTADHGEEFWDHARLEAKLGGDPRGFYGVEHGHSMFQELLHVPLVMAGPGVPRGRRIPQRVELLDVAPTVLAAAGVSVPQWMRGRDLRLLARGEGDELPGRAIIAESPAYGPDSRSLIMGRWKLITRVDGVELLYDLEGDPFERRNLVDERPREAAVLRALMSRTPKSERAEESSPPIPVDESTARQLRTLGYLK